MTNTFKKPGDLTRTSQDDCEEAQDHGPCDKGKECLAKFDAALAKIQAREVGEIWLSWCLGAPTSYTTGDVVSLAFEAAKYLVHESQEPKLTPMQRGDVIDATRKLVAVVCELSP